MYEGAGPGGEAIDSALSCARVCDAKVSPAVINQAILIAQSD